MMLGDKIAARDAEKMGMIYKAVNHNVFKSSINKIAGKLSQMPTKGLGYTKQALNTSLQNSLETQLKIEEELQYKAGITEDYTEGVKAFIEKRKPEFKGK